MAVNVLKLKKDAVAAGMDTATAKKSDRATLEAFLAAQSKPVTKKKSTPARIAKKKSGTARRAPVKRAPVKRGRPAKAAPAKRTPAAKKPVARRTASSNNSGRVNLGTLDFTVTSEDWNPRHGSGTQRLFAALKSSRGNVDKALAKLEGQVYDFVGKTMRDGTKRNKASALEMLRYRLNRTKFDFAKATGQHQSADAKHRAAYGTGQYATVRAVKPARVARKAAPKATARKTTARKAPVKRGRPAKR